MALISMTLSDLEGHLVCELFTGDYSPDDYSPGGLFTGRTIHRATVHRRTKLIHRALTSFH